MPLYSTTKGTLDYKGMRFNARGYGTMKDTQQGGYSNNYLSINNPKTWREVAPQVTSM